MANGKKKSKKKIIVLSIIGALVLIIAGLVIFGGNKEDIVLVQTEKASKRTITQVVSATGKIQPEFKVVITPEVSGEIVALPVKEGDRVTKGTLLLKIKQNTYLAQRERVAANLASARSNLSIQKIQMNKIESDFNRVRELYGKGLSSDAEIEAIRAQYETTKAQVQSAEASVQQAEASLKEASEQLAKTTILSPMDGIVSQLNVKSGERILGTGFTQGSNLMTVADLKKMEVVVEVDENDVVLISVGDTAKIDVDAYPDKKFTAVVYEIGNTAKAKGLGTQEEVVNFEVKIRILNSEVALKPGMSANADIQTETRIDVVTVPIQSVTTRMPKKDIAEKDDSNPAEESASSDKQSNANAPLRGKNEKPSEGVFIVQEGKAKFLKVKTGISDDTYIEIKEGLKGEEEVVSGSYRAISRELQEDSKVRVDNTQKRSGQKES
ncbi:MAG: efflux RND transporter periplasmic adaptor subunit [Bacteroidetes bacterium]|nr:efflux RND transporter periplasmic adaptor subunit [Bacteroidota bacterium]MBU2585968.1 efflux RND transporter periplasmic adaptor subunit [Bacteroidota bacterium]